MPEQISPNDWKRLGKKRGIHSKPLNGNAVRKMGVDLLPDRKLAASISGHRRIGSMYTTLVRQYAIGKITQRPHRGKSGALKL
jgi:hypothetical protein